MDYLVICGRFWEKSSDRNRRKLDIYFLTQSVFPIPERTIKNNSSVVVLFNQKLKLVEINFREKAVFYGSNAELKSFQREVWEKNYSYLHTDPTKKRLSGFFLFVTNM